MSIYKPYKCPNYIIISLKNISKHSLRLTGIVNRPVRDAGNSIVSWIGGKMDYFERSGITDRPVS